MRKDYDVVVVGGGPGGSSAAKTLAENGLDVILFEKRPSIGSEKRCAEGLSIGTISIIEEKMGKIPKRCIAKMINGAVVYAPNGKKVDVDFGENAGAIMERKIFDKWLAAQASKAGAYVQAKTNVYDVIKEGESIKGVKIELDGKKFEIRCKVVVAADGVESTIARKAGLNTTNLLVNIDSGYQYEMSNLRLRDHKKIELWFGNEIAPRGYIWIFPKGEDLANVGIGVAMSDKPAKYYLDKFIEDNPEIFSGASIIEVNSGGIPVGGFLKNMVMNGLVVVGDAAHQVNPIHGGGMKEATIAGHIAGEVIAKAIKNNDMSILNEYNNLWWKERGKHLQKVERLREVVEKLSDEDFNNLADVLEGDDLIEFSRGKRLLKLGKILLKKPSLITLAKKLME